MKKEGVTENTTHIVKFTHQVNGCYIQLSNIIIFFTGEQTQTGIYIIKVWVYSEELLTDMSSLSTRNLPESPEGLNGSDLTSES